MGQKGLKLAATFGEGTGEPRLSARLTHGGLRQDRLLARHLGNAHHFILLVPHLRNLQRSLPLTPNLANPTGRANVAEFFRPGRENALPE